MLNEDFRPKYMQQSRHDDGKDLISRADAIEAIDKLPTKDTPIKFYEVYRMAINDAEWTIDALPSADAVPQGRLINADSLISDLEEWKENPNNDDSAVDLVNHFIGIIRATPSADAVQGWRIGKPTEQGKYMVTLDSFGHKHIDLFYYGKPMMPNRKVRGRCWYRSDDEWGDVVYDDTDILAWMPLPKPYKGGAE